MSDSPSGPPATSRAALVSLVLGLAALPLGALAGLPALLVGLRALRAVNASDGALGGRRQAVVGMALGAVGCLATIVCVTALVIVALNLRAQRAGCMNNLRLIGQATNRYATRNNQTFPPAGLPGPTRTEDRLSWLAAVLPDLGTEGRAAADYQALAGKLNRGKPWSDPANAEALNTPVRVFLCPGHPHYDPRHRPGLTHYVGVAGIGPEARELPTASPRAGMFGYRRRVRREDVLAGISFTMLALETAQNNGPWLAAGEPTTRELAPDEENYLGTGRPFGGLHGGGANVLYVDGSVRWVSDKVPPGDFRAQATLAGKAEE